LHSLESRTLFFNFDVLHFFTANKMMSKGFTAKTFAALAVLAGTQQPVHGLKLRVLHVTDAEADAVIAELMGGTPASPSFERQLSDLSDVSDLDLNDMMSDLTDDTDVTDAEVDAVIAEAVATDDDDLFTGHDGMDWSLPTGYSLPSDEELEAELDALVAAHGAPTPTPTPTPAELEARMQ